MPFSSKKQQAYLFSQKPEIAEEFADKTPKSAYSKLPDYAKDKNRLKDYSKKHRRKR